MVERHHYKDTNIRDFLFTTLRSLVVLIRTCLPLLSIASSFSVLIVTMTIINIKTFILIKYERTWKTKQYIFQEVAIYTDGIDEG
jgi:hypothetical protein